MRVTQSALLGFYVEGLDSIHARLVTNGVSCVGQPEHRFGLKVGLYEDPDGIYFTLAAPVATLVSESASL